MLVLAYLGIFAVIPLVVEKNDPEVQWHAKHGLVLLVAEIFLFLVIGVLHFIPFLGWILGCLMFAVLPLAIFVLHIFCIYKAINGQRFLIPGPQRVRRPLLISPEREGPRGLSLSLPAPEGKVSR